VLVVKGRSAGRGLPVLLADAAAAHALVGAWPPVADVLVARFWPGALTLVLPRTSRVPDRVAAGETVAVRVPDHPRTRALIRAAGCPLIGTSANRAGEPPATTAQEAVAALGTVVDVILDGGPSPVGRPSTVLDLSAPPVARVLRAGAIRRDQLGPILSAHGWVLAASGREAPAPTVPRRHLGHLRMPTE
jgi:L-threonylcarbamoyladenylate synthase